MHNLITEIQSMGIRVSPKINGRKGGAGPAEGRAFIIEGAAVTAPISGHYVPRSPYTLKEDNMDYLLMKDGRPVASIGVVPEPEFYKHKSDDGVNFKKIALLHGKDCMATTVLQRCVHWKNSKKCGFCATETSLVNNGTLEIKTPAQLAQAAVAAHEMDGIKHIVLTSGTGDPPGSEIPYLAGCTRAIKEKVNIPVQVQFAPPEDIALMDELYDAGADSVGIHVESFDLAVLENIAPAKAEIGMDSYERAWKRAVELFGPNQVSSFLITGLGESDESVAWGSELLADLGVFPFVVPLRPIPGSRLQNLIPPNPDHMKRIYNSVTRILQKKGLSTSQTKAGCVKCGACSALSVYEPLFPNAICDSSQILCHSARTNEEIQRSYEIRREVFVKEQGIFDDSDLDDNDAGSIYLVAKKHGKVIGTVRIFEHDPGNGHWIGGRLAVAITHRNTHAGSLLVKEAMKRVKKRGCRIFTADIQEKNISFFKSLGWKPIGEIKDHFGYPHLKMQADLSRVKGDFI